MTPFSALAAAAAVAGGIALLRARSARRCEQAVSARLALDSDGVVNGAGTIDLPGDGRRGALLLHGFGDTPQTLCYLADHLHRGGWGVRAPLLPGHGRTLREFAAARADVWFAFAREELAAFRRRYDSVALVGLSMGGSLATILAADDAELSSLVLLAPYLSMPTRLQRVAAAHWALGCGVVYLHGRGERSIRDPDEVRKNLSYGFTTPRLLYELAAVVARARAAAPRVTAPTLVVQSREDNRIPPDAAERAFALFEVPDRRQEWTEGNGHIITVDYGRERVFDLVTEWLMAHPSRLPTHVFGSNAATPVRPHGKSAVQPTAKPAG